VKEQEIQALIAYRLNRAEETLAEARLMQREGHWNACANRLYYAARHGPKMSPLKEATNGTNLHELFSSNLCSSASLRHLFQ
jgi:hypothetical protein